MAASSDYTKPTYQDMSHLCPINLGLNAGSSMSAGNTVSGQPVLHGGPGTEPANPPPPGTIDDVASINVPSVTSYVKKVGN